MHRDARKLEVMRKLGDAQHPIGVFLVAKALVDLCDTALSVRQNNLAHPHGDIALDEVCRGFRNDFAPALDAEAAVERVVVAVTDEVRQGAIASRAGLPSKGESSSR